MPSGRTDQKIQDRAIGEGMQRKTTEPSGFETSRDFNVCTRESNMLNSSLKVDLTVSASMHGRCRACHRLSLLEHLFLGKGRTVQEQA